MSAPEGLSVGVDVGGTFTDLVAVAPDGDVQARKVLSTPHDQSEGVESALGGLDPARVERIVHGTTVATNALLERSGARVHLCATRGFTDLLRLRRQDRASLYDLAAAHPEPLVDDGDVLAVNERIAPEGVVRALTDAEAARIAGEAAGRGARVVAVALLHAHADAAHERALAQALARALPGADVVLSSDVFPEIREYERTATTVAEAYLRPGVSRYLERLAERLAAGGFPAPGVMTSSGGMRTARDAARSAAQLALSGPAGGVVGAAAVLRAAGIADALAIDIGGTSADVGLILDGAPLVEPGGNVAGVPIALPRVLVETVSAGGGSIGWVDDGGALRVGPRSAGAVPGPAAFRRGGTLPTITDAHVVLGNIAAARLSGAVTLDGDAAHAALAPLAARMGVDVARLARAMIATADATMARALRRVSVERGVDPRRCVLVPFGGGGPLHACGLADLLGMNRILVPPFAGVLSALGLALTAERREAMASLLLRSGTDAADALRRAVAGLSARLPAPAGWTRTTLVRARYAGQGHELDVPLGDGDDIGAVAERFAALHERRLGFRLDRPLELVSARQSVSGEPRAVTLARKGSGSWDAASPTDGGAMLDVVVRGPSSVALPDATMLVAPGWSARPLPIGGWMLERDA